MQTHIRDSAFHMSQYVETPDKQSECHCQSFGLRILTIRIYVLEHRSLYPEPRQVLVQNQDIISPPVAFKVSPLIHRLPSSARNPAI